MALVSSDGGRNARTSPEESSRRDKSSHALRPITLSCHVRRPTVDKVASWCIVVVASNVYRTRSVNEHLETFGTREKRSERSRLKFRLGVNVMRSRKVSKNFLCNKFYCYVHSVIRRDLRGFKDLRESKDLREVRNS